MITSAVPKKRRNALEDSEKNGPALKIDIDSISQKLKELDMILASLPIGDDRNAVLLRLRRWLFQETHSPVVVKILEVLSHLSMQPETDASPVVSSLVGFLCHVELQRVAFARVTTSVLDALRSILRVKRGDQVRWVIAICWKLLSYSSSSKVYIALMKLLVGLSDLADVDELIKLKGLVLAFTRNRDSRVRVVAFRYLFELLTCPFSNPDTIRSRGKSASGYSESKRRALDMILYRETVKALTDDSPQVRLEAARVIWILSNHYPENLVEDGFIKTSNMVMDTNWEVRVEACHLLGSLRGVSSTLIMQSLSKKVLRADVTRFNVSQDPCDGSRQYTADYVDIVKLSKENSLSSNGANGAFVHGLEDEFYQVRSTAIVSICEISRQSPAFAQVAAEYLVDMFNDDIDHVRISAILSLSKIGHLVQLSDEQLVSVLHTLEDASFDIRTSIHKLLSTIRFFTATSLKSVVHALLNGLQKYQDTELTFSTFKEIGLNQPYLVELVVKELLKLDTRLLLREPQLNDVCYIALLILIINAASININIISILPSFCPVHYAYLKDKYPWAVPKSIPELALVQKSHLFYYPSSSLVAIVRRIGDLVRSPPPSSSQLSHVVSQLREELSNISLAHSHSLPQFYLHYLGVVHPILSFKCQSDAPHAQFDRVLQQVHDLEHLYVGLSSPDKAQLQILRVFIHLTVYFIQLKTVSSLGAMHANVLCMISSCIQQLSSLNRSFYHQTIDHLRRVSDSLQPSPAPSLLRLIREFPLLPMSTTNFVKRRQVALKLPDHHHIDKPREFSYFHPLSLRVVATAHNSADSRSLFVCLTLPDRVSSFYAIPHQKVVPIGPLAHQISLSVPLYQGAWTSSSSVYISIVEVYSSDCACHSARPGACQPFLYTHLSEPVKYYIHPHH